MFRLNDDENGTSFAGKFVKKGDKENSIANKVLIHPSLKHLHIVSYRSSFSIPLFECIVLELNSNKVCIFLLISFAIL